MYVQNSLTILSNLDDDSVPKVAITINDWVYIVSIRNYIIRYYEKNKDIKVKRTF